MKACKIKVYGHVQGVFYRAQTLQKANELGIKGTVKNMPDGSVEIIAEAESDKLELLKEWCHKGPARAKVTSVIKSDVEVQGFKDFKIIG